MTKNLSKLLLQSSAIALVLPSAALAELSALDVWDGWKSLAESVGQTFTIGSQEASGGALILNGVQIGMEFPDGQFVSTLDFLEFRERSDGTVAVSMAETMPFKMTVNPADGEALDMTMVLRQNGTSIVASGDPGNISFDFLAARMDLSIEEFIVDGTDADMVMQFSMADLDGKYQLTTAGRKSYSSEMRIGSLTYDVAFTDPDTGGNFAMSGTIQDVASNSEVEVPEDLNFADPAQLFSGGFVARGGLSGGASNSSVQLQEPGGGFSLTTAGTSSALDFSIGDGSIQYGGNAKGVEYSVSSPQIPFPEVNLGFAEVAFNLLMPISQSDEPQDYALLIKLGGLEISDMIWGIFDPGLIMPRDPATISFDVSGSMNWLVDIMDPAIAEEFDGDTPAELYSLSLNELTVAAVGAQITGSGEFTFDNSDLETFDGLPAPTGAVSFNISGANGLMDRLVQMGFLQPDQLFGVRAMMGLFARPGAGEDELTSEIEVKSDGSVFANGQQLR